MSQKKPSIILIGAGAHCYSYIDLIEREGRFTITGIIDKAERVGQEIIGYPIIGTDEDIPRLFKVSPYFQVTIGQILSHKPRVPIYEKLIAMGGVAPTLISPEACCSRHATIGEGSIIMNGAILQSGAVVGTNSIVNTGSIIDHGSFVGDHTHVSANVTLAGEAAVGNYCFVGVSATLSHCVSIPDYTIIGAGALVHRTITEAGTYAGVPARKFR